MYKKDITEAELTGLCSKLHVMVKKESRMILEVSGIRDWGGDDGTDRAGNTRR